MKKLIILLVACFIWAASFSQRTMTSKEGFMAYLKGGQWIVTDSKPLVLTFTFKDNLITVNDAAHSIYTLNWVPLRHTDLILSYQATDGLGVHCIVNFMKMVGYGVIEIAYSNIELYYIIPPLNTLPDQKTILPDIKHLYMNTDTLPNEVDILISREMVQEAGPWVQNHNCPLAVEVRRLFNTDDATAGASFFGVGAPDKRQYYYLDVPFSESEHRRVLETGKPFITKASIKYYARTPNSWA